MTTSKNTRTRKAVKPDFTVDPQGTAKPPDTPQPTAVNLTNCHIEMHDERMKAIQTVANAAQANADAIVKLAEALTAPSQTYGVYISG